MEKVQAFLAGRYENRYILRHVREALNAGQVCHVVASWLDEEAPRPEVYDPEQATAIVRRNLEEIRACGLFLLDTSGEGSGREVELGIAIAQALPIIRVGPVRNVFHASVDTVDVAFPTWEEALGVLTCSELWDVVVQERVGKLTEELELLGRMMRALTR